MAIHIANADETQLEFIEAASSLHFDKKTMIVIMDASTLSDAQEDMLETEGLFVGFDIENPMIKTKSHIISSGDSLNGLNHNQYIVRFEL